MGTIIGLGGRKQISSSGQGIPEAPADGKQYARQDKDWSEVNALPEGGTEGQILTKTEEGAEWADAPTSDDLEAKEVTAAALTLLHEAVARIQDGHINKGVVLTAARIVDNLTTAYANYVLSAKQGKVLKDLSDANEEIIASALVVLDTYKGLASAIAKPHSPSREYSIGDCCTHEARLYKRLTAGSGVWNPTDWEETTVMDEINARIS